MKKKIFLLSVSMSFLLLMINCNKNEKKVENAMKKTAVDITNPLLGKFDTPFQVPPFSKIKNEHFIPAFKKAISINEQEIEKLIKNPEAPSFSNTIVALDKSGMLLERVENIFSNLESSNTNPQMQKMAGEVSGMLAKHSDNINLNPKLFKRVKTIYQQKKQLKLDGEDLMLLDETYKEFKRGGAELSSENQGKLREINIKLAKLSNDYDQNVLKETNKFQLVIDKEDLSGLPQDVIEAAKKRAKAKKMKDKWIFTTSKSNMIPFITFADKRVLREKLLKAYQTRGNHNDELDNKAIINQIVNYRLEKANLLGYKTYADYVLEESMAKKPKNVYQLMDKVWEPALRAAKLEGEELQNLIVREGKKFKLKPWDWWYYTEKLRKEKYSIKDSAVKPFFTLDNVRNGAFMVINKLFGLKYVERKDIPRYHKDVKVYEVFDKDGSHLGVLYFDPFSRPSKRGGAWMTSYRKQYMDGDKMIHPIVSVNYNFAKGSNGIPCMLSVDQTTTVFHELGHSLHGLLSNCRYHRLSGTSVPSDFVELPSQLMEHWAMNPQVMKMYALNYQTKKPISDNLIRKIDKTSHFNQGFITVEYLSAAYLDMDYHTLTYKKKLDIDKFEQESMKKIGLIPQIVVRYRSTFFTHITGGYAAGYYSYIWSGVLDNDAFEAFKEKGIFNRKTADSLRENIYSKGGTVDPMVLYKRFRGHAPDVKALLRNRGLIK